MIHVIEQHNMHQHLDLLEQMFRLRARIFHDRLGWDVQVHNGQERDRFDDEWPVYLIYVDDESEVIKGSLRLLPTTGPTLFSEVFADTVPQAAHLVAPSIWECTRFCLDDNLLDRRNQDEVQLASAVLIAALGELALRSGIESVLGNFDAQRLRLYRRIGCEVDVLGCTTRFGRTVFLGLFPVSWSVLQNVRTRMKRTGSVSFDRTKSVHSGERISA